MAESALSGNKAVWIYKYEQDGLYPIMEVGEDTQSIKYEINNSFDSLYTFCKVEIDEEESGEFDLVETYSLKVPGDEQNPKMDMFISNQIGSPFVYIVVKNTLGDIIVEENFLVTIPEVCDNYLQLPLCENVEEVNTEPILEEELSQLEEMTGLEEMKSEVQRLIECVKLEQIRKKNGLPPLEMSHHLVFTGNPGTGKTTVARLLSRIYAALGVTSSEKFVETDRSGLVEGYVGQTAIKTKKVLDSARGGILYIDEAYTLAKDGNDFGQEAIDTILKEMEDHRDDLIVIVAGYSEQMNKFIFSNPGLKSRFKTFINFKDYSGEELYEIFTVMCKKHGMTVEETAIPNLKEHFMKMAKNKGPQFANGREVRNFFEGTIARQAHRLSNEIDPSTEKLSVLTMEDLGIEDVKDIQTAAIEELNAMVGLRDVKNEVSDLVNMILNQQMREKNGLPTKKISCHMVFAGNPGTGKTTVARILTRILKSIGVIDEDKLIEVDSSMLIAGYTGQTAIKTKDVIHSAIGGVLFIDEAYTLERSVGGFGQEAIDTLLKAMEDYRDNLVVIVAGYEDEINKFIKSNPGLESRFNNYIHFEDYSSDELYGILEMYCDKERYQLEPSAQELMRNYISENRMKLNGNARDIRNIYEKIKKQQAARLSGKECSLDELITITKEDVEKVMSALMVKNNKFSKEDGIMNTVFDSECGNILKVVSGEFGGVPMTQAEEIKNLTQTVKSGKGLVMGPGGVIKAKDDSSIKPEGGNFTEVKAGTFAAGHPDQWYEKNKLVYQGEIAEMRRQYPDAQMGFLQSTGDMYWVVTLNMSETGAIKPYKIMLLYDKTHPSNINYGGSVKSVLLDPDVSELRERARKAGRFSVPHLLGNESSFVYLCTRLPKQVQAGKMNLSAVQAAGNTADWILAFELGLRDKNIWNHKFCGDAHRNCWVA